MSASLRVDRVVTSGTFSLDGGTWDVDNNVWVVGDDGECVVVDAAHDHGPILDAVAGRRVVARTRVSSLGSWRGHARTSESVLPGKPHGARHRPLKSDPCGPLTVRLRRSVTSL